MTIGGSQVIKCYMRLRTHSMLIEPIATESCSVKKGKNVPPSAWSETCLNSMGRLRVVSEGAEEGLSRKLQAPSTARLTCKSRPQIYESPQDIIWCLNVYSQSADKSLGHYMQYTVLPVLTEVIHLLESGCCIAASGALIVDPYWIYIVCPAQWCYLRRLKYKLIPISDI